MSKTNLETLKKWIEHSNNIVFFGGAGVSTESGIPDFRSVDGVYNINYEYSPETILSHSFFVSHTEDFYRFYRDKMIHKDASANITHFKLAQLEKDNKLRGVITQNIDGLHQIAGSKNVLELHGSIHRNHCMKCESFYSLTNIINSNENIPRCQCGGIIKPDVVLYEEGLDNETLDNAINLITEADVLIVGGTSLSVYPAAGLIRYYQGNKLVLINKSITPYDKYADLLIQDSLGQVFHEL